MTGEINKPPRKRSPAYPSINLKVAVELVERLHDSFSEYGFSREAVSEKLSMPKTSATDRKIAALVHYGLLNREGSSYKISPLAKNIVLNDDEAKKLSLLKKAVMKPKIYTTLINENSGKSMPASLDIRLRQLDYSKKAAKSLVNIFRDSIEYAGLLINGIVTDPSSIKDQTSTEGEVDENSDTPRIDTGTPSEGVGVGGADQENYVPYTLDCGIIVQFPNFFIKKIIDGTFKKPLDELEKAGKEEQDGRKNIGNAPDASME